ncbi:MAG: DUF2235 domain-containing protein [Castellaniella sp.]
MPPFAPALILATLMLLSRPALAQCTPAAIGPPCAQAGLTLAPGHEPALNLGAGNPVHLVTGNKYQREIDLPPSRSMPGLEIIRHYNALDPRASALGSGWQLSYDSRLYRLPQGRQIVQADGSRLHFPGHGTAGTLVPGPGGQTTWQRPDGGSMDFDAQGRPIRLQKPGSEPLTLERHPPGSPFQGMLHRVSNTRGQSLAFEYAQNKDGTAQLRAIITPAGRFDYRYAPAASAAANLVQVRRPDGLMRLYDHDPAMQGGHAHALTGIAIGNGAGRRLSIGEWAYDENGRVTHWSAGNTRLHIDYRRTPDGSQPGLTIVSDARGRQTRFHTAQRGRRHVLLEVDGAGCPGCAAPGIRARYDARGRLLSLGGTTLLRDTHGRIRGLQASDGGWPGLRMHFDDNGRMQAWHSTVTGTLHLDRDARGRVTTHRHANGDTLALARDARHRPVRIDESHGDAQTTTRLIWGNNRHDGHLRAIHHPNERQSITRDRRGRIVQRITLRTNADGKTRRWEDGFRHDDQGRRVEHHLPEGGRLHFIRDARSSLAAIEWIRADGQRITLWQQQAGAVWQWANGLHLYGDHEQLQLTRDEAQIWTQHRRQDRLGRILEERFVLSTDDGLKHQQHWRYAYDAQHRLIGAQEGESPAHWHAWNADGSTAGRRTPRSEAGPPRWQRDASGLPRVHDGYALGWSAGRRLAEVRTGKHVVARYRHNALGYRIARETADGRRTDYFHLDGQLVAQSHAGARRAISRRYVYAGLVPVAFIDYSDDAPQGVWYAIHTDQLGAPRLVTDARARVRWAAHYTPLGQANIIAGDISLDLRLPGQVFDAATGWHDNLLRTYDPVRGHYLEPDPLGPVPGNQAYGYAAQQPRRHLDPSGLLLFAFDGTRQSAATGSNVWKLAQLYADGAAHYHDGPGNALYMDWDALTASDVGRILDTQWQWLLLELARAGPGTVTPIDIIGFSRGAALARHFGNLITEQVDQGRFHIEDRVHGSISACVDLRFMGLFDTVSQFGVGGVQNRNYDLGISQAWQWVSHAVALHEHRWLFPLNTAADGAATQVVEAAFIGAHGDIGGGASNDGGDLDKIALQWMRWQATAASVGMGAGAAADRTVDTPILHDARSTIARRLQDGDRSVLASDHRPLHNYQQDHPRLGAVPRAQTEDFIQRLPGREATLGPTAGEVDMQGYREWLQQTLGWPAPPV